MQRDPDVFRLPVVLVPNDLKAGQIDITIMGDSTDKRGDSRRARHLIVAVWLKTIIFAEQGAKLRCRRVMCGSGFSIRRTISLIMPKQRGSSNSKA